ncbi:MAG: chromosome segregation protein SMC [Elusimicrobiota bacterium]
MYLKSLEILGFKSFADRTRIELRPGITGIVGPNGCGKSNVMDAVRWCIGEMSWKSLRSDSMVSVIFAGTSRRASMGLSEVTLTFDNAQSMLPVQFSEVSVTRRIFRSGESEYYLNKTQCRLRDIRELFFDTGIGNDGYAIIDQGGVDFVLQSKPEDRRALFEEAAGVAKYKAKREEALRKLDRVEIDLGRLQDQVALLNDQLKKLDADARKARLFQKYQEELAALAAAQLLHEVDAVDAEASSERALLTPIQEKLAALRSGIDADEARLAALSLERASQETAAMERQARIGDCISEKGRLEERIQNADVTSRDIAEQRKSSDAEGVRESARVAELEPSIAAARKTYEEAAAALAQIQAERDAFEGELDALEKGRDEAQRELDGVRSRKLSLQEAAQESSRRLSQAQSQIGQMEYEVRGALKDLEKALVNLEAERGLAAADDDAVTARTREAQEARARVDAGEADLRAARGAAEQAGRELERLRGESVRLKTRIETIQAQGEADVHWVGAHAVCRAGIPGVVGTVRSLLQMEESSRAQVEDVLGDRLYAVVCERLEAAQAGIRHLRESGRGRARFLVLSTLPEVREPAALPPGARRLFDRVRSDPAYSKAVAFLLGEAYTFEGSLYGKHWVTGGAEESVVRGPKLSDIEESRAALEGVERSLAEGERLLQERIQAVATAESALAEARAAVSESDLQLHMVRNARDQKLRGLALQEQEAGLFEADAVRRLAEMASKLEEIQGLRQALSERGGAEDELRRREEAVGAKLAALVEQVAGKRGERQLFDKSIANQQTAADFTKQHFDRLAGELENLERAATRRREQHAAWELRLQELAAQGEQARQALDALHRELAQLENERKTLLEKVQVLQMQAGELEASLRARKGEADEHLSKVHAAEVKLSQLAAKRDMLERQLAQEWRLTCDEARAKYKDQPSDPERIDFLRRRIAAIGQVNMAAPEEYEELTKKRDRLQSQVDDLGQARQDLHSVIARINATTRENFRQTFQEVREHFRKLYGILFDGGEADLVFTDKENLLETGVEIVAQPPGKRLQSISQLSGGEKTLTAIALLFAFFMVRPSPFCMLDEADAALDEANIDRFLSLLREFGGKTQFLMVSHNKRTMEACDVIYGITMEESGVSQMISVDFRKKEGSSESAPQAEMIRTT